MPRRRVSKCLLLAAALTCVAASPAQSADALRNGFSVERLQRLDAVLDGYVNEGRIGGRKVGTCQPRAEMAQSDRVETGNTAAPEKQNSTHEQPVVDEQRQQHRAHETRERHQHKQGAFIFDPVGKQSERDLEDDVADTHHGEK